MTVLADTSPVNYLILIGEVDVLPRLFGKVIIPASVKAEMRHPRAPSMVAQWLSALPDWVEVKTAQRMESDIALGAGEREAISLALELGIPAVLMDDRKGRLAAESRGLIAVGTLNILDAADDAGLLKFDEALTKLDQTTFRVRAELMAAFQENVRRRKEGR